MNSIPPDAVGKEHLDQVAPLLPEFPRYMISSIILLTVNVLPIFAVLLIGWDAFTLLALYLLENVTISLLTIVRITLLPHFTHDVMARKQVSPSIIAANYSLFLVVQIVFVYYAGKMCGASDPNAADWTVVLRSLVQHLQPGFALIFVGLLISHLVSFTANFLIGREYRLTTPKEFDSRASAQMLVMCLTVMFGAFILGCMGIRGEALAFLVLIKLYIDFKWHSGARRQFLLQLQR